MRSLLSLSLCVPILLLSSCGGGGNSASTGPVISGPETLTFSTKPAETAMEAEEYSVTLKAVSSTNSAVTYTMTTAPTGAVLNGNTIRWTPTAAQARAAHNFAVSASSLRGGSASQSWTVSTGGTMRGSVIHDRSTALGIVKEPEDLSAQIVEVHDGTNVIAGAGSADGRFTVPRVPLRAVWLRVGHRWVWTDASETDMGAGLFGRANSEIASPGTSVSFSLTGYDQISTVDRVHFVLPNNSWTSSLAVASISESSARTASAIPNNMPLPDPSVGDMEYIVHHRRVSLTPVLVERAQNAAGPTERIIPDAVQTQFPVVLAPLPIENTVNIAVKGSEFAALRSLSSPNATDFLTEGAIVVQPFGTALGLISTTRPPVLVRFAPTTQEAVKDFDLGAIPFGNPYPASWTPFVSYRDLVFKQLPQSTSIASGTYVFSTTLPSADQPLRPVVGPPTSPTINGSSFFSDRSAITLTPMVEWQAPNVGTASSYYVRVFAIRSNEITHFLDIVRVADLYTNQNSVRVPEGVLTADGGPYLFVVFAVARPGTPAASHMRVGTTWGMGTAVSGMLVP